MARDQVSPLLDPIRRLIGAEGGCALTDTELLEKFVASADPTSFEVLVWRHGAMVLGLCRRVLRDRHEAEDAFQATFLVFARKAGSIGQREAVGCWLYKVGYRIALRLRAAAIKRPTTGEPTDELPAPEPTEDADWRDLRPVLDEEIARLPEKYRAPFVLCYLEGRTNEEAAVQLGCPKGTILSRLARGREWLRTRLTRRGVVLTAASLTLTLSRNAVSAAVPTVLTRSTVNAAIPFAAGKAATEFVSTAVAALTDGVLRTMILAKVKIAAMALLSLTLMGTGITWAARGEGQGVHSPAATDVAAAAPTATPAPIAEPSATEPANTNVILDEDPDRLPADQPERGRGDDEPTTGGKVVAIAGDGKSFTIDVPTQMFVGGRNVSGRNQIFTKTTIKITEKTAITYHNVLENGAKLTAGYHAGVRLEKGSKDVAAVVRFTGDERGRRAPNITGEVVGSTKDTITLMRREQGAEKKETIPFNKGTLIVFNSVAAGEAKITQGYHAQVYLADDGKTTDLIQLSGKAGDAGRPPIKARDTRFPPDLNQQPEIHGTVVAVSADGKTLTVESSPGGRNVEPKNRQEIKIGDKTSLVYNNVLLDGTKPTEGYGVWVWLAEGSKDTAVKLGFTGTLPPESGTVIKGKVVEVSAVGKEGRTISIEQSGARGEEPKRTKVKIPTTAKVAYNGVGPDEAKPTVGYSVTLRLRDGSTDTAKQVNFFKTAPVEERKRER